MLYNYPFQFKNFFIGHESASTSFYTFMSNALEKCKTTRNQGEEISGILILHITWVKSCQTVTVLLKLKTDMFAN